MVGKTPGLVAPLPLDPLRRGRGGRPTGRTRARLVALAMLPFLGLALGIAGLLMFPLLAGPFLAYAFHLARPVRDDRRMDKLLACAVNVLTLAFLPALFVVAFITSIATTVVPTLEGFEVEAVLVVLVYVSSMVCAGLAAHYITLVHGTQSEQRLVRRLRWPLVASAAWVCFFFVLEVVFERPYLSVDFAGIGAPGLFAAGAVLVVWVGLAAFRTFRPAQRPQVAVVEAGTADSPVFTAFRG